jgi:hypothetical protein
MAHIQSIGASKFTTLDYVPATVAEATASSSAATLHGLFCTAVPTSGSVEVPEAAVVHVGNVREFPSIGTPANVVNVPVYGQATSSQVSGQSDAPSLEFSLNYVPADHAALDTLRKSSTRLAFRVRICDADLTTDSDSIITAEDTDSFADFIFFGTIASFEITPGLTDAMQASMTLTVDGDFSGPFSLVGSNYALPS